MQVCTQMRTYVHVRINGFIHIYIYIYTPFCYCILFLLTLFFSYLKIYGVHTYVARGASPCEKPTRTHTHTYTRRCEPLSELFRARFPLAAQRRH